MNNNDAPSFDLPKQRSGVQQTNDQPKIFQARVQSDYDDYDFIMADDGAAAAAPHHQSLTTFESWTEPEIRAFLDRRGEDFDDCLDLESLIARARKCEHETGPAIRPAAGPNGQQQHQQEEEEEVDPLDAFMAEMKELESVGAGGDGNQESHVRKKVKREVERLDDEDHLSDFLQVRKKGAVKTYNPPPSTAGAAGTAGEDYDSDAEVYAAASAADAAAALKPNTNQQYTGEESDEDVLYSNTTLKQKTVIDAMAPLDHSTIKYQDFAKDFYEEDLALTAMSPSEVADYRKLLGVRVSGFHVPKPIKEFEQCGFEGLLEGAIKKAGYKEPTAIQAQALPAVLSGRDVLGIAKTGSGKTAAFVLPMIVHVMDQPELEKNQGPIAVIVAPTRELAQQIHKEARRFGKAYNLQICAAFGGLAKHQQFRELKSGAEIAVCTPGRMLDLIKMKACSMHRVTYLVFDEADRMFDMGFEPQVRSLVGQIRPDRQTLLFSATMPRKVERLAADVLTSPIRITVGNVGAANSDVNQTVEVLASDEEKQQWLIAHLEAFIDQGDVLVFANQKAKVEEIKMLIENAGVGVVNNAVTGLATGVEPPPPSGGGGGVYKVACIHGDMDQYSRMEVLNGFKGGKFHVLVATDVAARGLDIKTIKTVINYDVAKDIDTHIHRIGRTGRAGDKEGLAYTLILPTQPRAAADLVQCLAAAGQEVSEALHVLAAKDPRFKKGVTRGRGGGKVVGGFGGSSSRQRKGGQVGGAGLGFGGSNAVPIGGNNITGGASGSGISGIGRLPLGGGNLLGGGSYESGQVTGFAPSHAREDVHFASLANAPPLTSNVDTTSEGFNAPAIQGEQGVQPPLPPEPEPAPSLPPLPPQATQYNPPLPPIQYQDQQQKHQEDEEEQYIGGIECDYQPPLPPLPPIPQGVAAQQPQMQQQPNTIQYQPPPPQTNDPSSSWGATKRSFVNQQFRSSFVSSGTTGGDLGAKPEIVMPKKSVQIIQPPHRSQPPPASGFGGHHQGNSYTSEGAYSGLTHTDVNTVDIKNPSAGALQATGRARVLPPPPVPVNQQPLYLQRQQQQQFNTYNNSNNTRGGFRFGQAQQQQQQQQQAAAPQSAAQAEALQRAVAQAQAVAARLAAQAGVVSGAAPGGNDQQKQWQWGGGGR